MTSTSKLYIQNKQIKISNITIKGSKCEKFLVVKTNNRPMLNMQVEDMCKKGSQELHILIRVTPYTSVSKKRLLINPLFRI